MNRQTPTEDGSKRQGGPPLRIGMAHQVGGLVLLSLIVFGLITGLIIRTQYADSLRQDLLSKGQSIAYGIVSGMGHMSVSGERGAMEQLLKGFSKIYGVAYIVIFDGDGRPLWHTLEGPVPEDVAAEGKRTQGARELRIEEMGDILDVAVVSGGPEPLYVHVGMDMDVVARSLERVPVIVWRIILVSILCATSVGIIVYFRTIRPIYRLTEYVKQIGMRATRQRFPIRSSGEIGLLARSLEQMNAELERYHRQLEDKTRELERSKEELQRQNEEIKRAQIHMIRSEKFAAMGQLAASVAHEISNPLAGILTYLKLIRRKLDTGEDIQENIETYRRYLLTMEKETERCGHIMKNLLDFARSSEPNLKEIDIHRVIEDTLFLLNFKLMMSDVQVERDYQRDIPPVSGDFGQLKQVFLNVILNALEAMKGETRVLRIATSYHVESNTVLVEVQDTGEGISEENIYKVFDPFFTTKPRGTGMGLAVVYSILDKHNADIIIDSEPGKGTKVTIQLNVAGESSKGLPAAASE